MTYRTRSPNVINVLLRHRDPDFSATRVAHLQYTLTAVQLLQSQSGESCPALRPESPPSLSPAAPLSSLFNYSICPPDCESTSTGPASASSLGQGSGGDVSGVAVRRAKDIARAVVLDHTQGLHVLSRELTNKFHRLVQERVKFCRLQCGWKEVIEWCDLLLTFVSPSDNATKVPTHIALCVKYYTNNTII